MRKKRIPAETHPPIAVSYVRFFTPEQGKGDSIRRQTEDSEKWCERNGIPLDTTLTDKGRSAYHGRHRDDKAALGSFLELVKQGNVPRGSFLIVENLDRLSREDERTALRLWMDILDAGISIVQLHPETVFHHDKGDMLDMMRAIIELSRGHSESRMKAVRAEANWLKRYRLAREEGALLTAWLPAWIQARDGRLELIPERAETVKTIFQLAISGYGQGAIARKLREDKAPAFGPTGGWSAEYIRRILKDRRAVGELQPRSGPERKANGKPIPNYYPSVVSEEEWTLARAAISGRRRNKQGRLGDKKDGVANLFGGLLCNARDGRREDGKPVSTYLAAVRTDGGKKGRVLMSSGFFDGAGPCYSFPLDIFEHCLLTGLSEINPADIVPRISSGSREEVLSKELAWLREKKDELSAELLNGAVSVIAQKLRQLEAREAELVAALDEIQEQAVKPLGDSWKDIRTLADLHDKAEDKADVRIRLRAAIRRTIRETWMIVVRRGTTQLCAVQAFFHEGQAPNDQRSYLIVHQPARGNASKRTESRTRWRTLADDASLGPLDLRKPADAAKVEALLSAVNLETLAAAMRELPGLPSGEGKS